MDCEGLLRLLEGMPGYSWHRRESVIYGEYLLGRGAGGERVRLLARPDGHEVEVELPAGREKEPGAAAWSEAVRDAVKAAVGRRKP